MAKTDYKAKLKKIEEKSSGGGGDFYEWKDGANLLRILPSWKGTDEQFYLEDAIHYNIGPDKVRVRCRKLIGKPCAVCEASDKAYKSGDKKGAGNLRGKSRYYVNAIDLNNPDAGVQTLAFGASVLKSILTYLVDEDDEWGEWWDKKKRYDFKIVRKGEKLDTEYTVFPTKKFLDVKTPSGAEPKDLEALASKLPSYDEQVSILAGEEYEGTDEDEEVEAEEEEEVETKPTKKSKKAEPEEEEEDAEEETAEEDAEEETEDEEKEDEPEAEEEDAEEEASEPEEDEPACFKDPGQHDPNDDICQDCSFLDACGKAVAKKIAAEPKKYAKAPLALLKSKPAKKAKDEDDEDVEEELKRSVKAGKVKKGSRK